MSTENGRERPESDRLPAEWLRVFPNGAQEPRAATFFTTALPLSYVPVFARLSGPPAVLSGCHVCTSAPAIPLAASSTFKFLLGRFVNRLIGVVGTGNVGSPWCGGGESDSPGRE